MKLQSVLYQVCLVWVTKRILRFWEGSTRRRGVPFLPFHSYPSSFSFTSSCLLSIYHKGQIGSSFWPSKRKVSGTSLILHCHNDSFFYCYDVVKILSPDQSQLFFPGKQHPFTEWPGQVVNKTQQYALKAIFQWSRVVSKKLTQ